MEKITNTQKKRESAITEIVGVSAEIEHELLENIKRIFDAQPLYKYERPKTSEEKLLIADLNGRMQEFVRRFGGSPISLISDHIHFFDEEKMTLEIKEKLKDSGGFFSNDSQEIWILPWPKNLLRRAQNIAHEMIHFNSWNSYIKSLDKATVKTGGFTVSIKGNKERIFETVDEGIVATLVKLFDQEFFRDISVLKSQVQERQDIIEAVKQQNPETDYSDVGYAQIKRLESGEDEADLQWYPQSDDRKYISILVEEIYEKNKLQFSSPREVFDIFARTIFTGDFKPVAQLIEKTFGSGAFKRIAEETKKVFKTSEI